MVAAQRTSLFAIVLCWIISAVPGLGSTPSMWSTTNPPGSSDTTVGTETNDIPVKTAPPQGLSPLQNSLAGTALGALLIIAVALGLYRPMKKIFCKGQTKRVTFSTETLLDDRKHQRETANEHCLVDETSLDTRVDKSVVNQAGSTGIPLDRLRSYINAKRVGGGFKNEYNGIPSREMLDCNVASLPENTARNTFKNIKAYDSTRVVLEMTSTDGSSDYINANYISGYKQKKSYIATQGPTEKTTAEFWRMIWQEKSNRIIMLTRIAEKGQKTSEQYWPVKLGGKKEFGEFRVVTMRKDFFTAFTICILQVRKGDETRTVRHLQYIGWQDRSAPYHAYPFLDFRRKVRSLDCISIGPMIVHCSAGIGRTGTFIALDYLLEQANHDSKIDVITLVKQLRSERMEMVQTLHQYKFLYFSVLEAITIGETAVPLAELPERMQALTAVEEDEPSLIQYEFQDMKSPHPSEKSEGQTAPNIDKNSKIDILPDDKMRPTLKPSGAHTNTYINAVYVDDFRSERGIIATQMPIFKTVDDFWRLVYQHKRTTLVMLNALDKNDKNCAVYWPDSENPKKRFGNTEITFLSSDTSGSIALRVFQVANTQNNKESPMIVRQFQLLDWPASTDLPKIEPLLELIGNVARVGKATGDHSIVVHCNDGATRCGLFCAATFLARKMKSDQEVDVFHAVRCVSNSRPQFVNTLAQYQFLYTMAKQDVSLYGVYSNM